MLRNIERQLTRSAYQDGIARPLLMCGIVVGPLFYVVAVIQMFIRPGFDIRHHAISLLSLGDLGWIQIANFLLTGTLAIFCGIGLRQTLRGRKAGTHEPSELGWTADCHRGSDRLRVVVGDCRPHLSDRAGEAGLGNEMNPAMRPGVA